MTWWWSRRRPSGPDVGQGLADLQQEVRRVARQLLLAEARWEAIERGLGETRAGIAELRGRPAPQPVADGATEAGRRQLVLAVIEGLDGLEQAAASLSRAGASGASGAEGPGLLDVLGRVHRHILRALAQAGVEPVPAEAVPFDPRVHRAVARVPAAGQVGRVVAVDRRGYRLDGSVLRFAEVIVGTEPEPVRPEPEPLARAAVPPAGPLGTAPSAAPQP